MPRAQTSEYEVERWADKRWNQAARMERSLADMRDAYEDVERLIDLVDGDLRTVLMRRYLLNEAYESISEKLHCHRNTVNRWHDKAVWQLVKMVLNGAL
jgi:DNA-directed RNA polymerase specialized sigma24 family protein